MMNCYDKDKVGDTNLCFLLVGMCVCVHVHTEKKTLIVE